MQVTVESTSNLGRKMRVQIPAERIDAEIEKRLKSISRQIKIDGFRPGKAPLRVLKQKYGRQVRQEVLGEVLQSSYREAVTQENLRPVSSPQIEPDLSGEAQGLNYTASFEVYPEIEAVSCEGLNIARPVAEITEADVDKTIEDLRKRRQTWEPVDRVAKLGDQIVVDFSGFIDDEPFEGGAGEDFALELGSGHMVPGFEDQLVGVTAQEHKSITVTFPENYPVAELVGKQARFEVDVERVSQPVLPQLNEEFMSSFGVKEGGLEAFRREVRENMERELQDKVKARTKNQVMDGLLAQNNIDLPSALVKQEVEGLREQMMAALGQKDASKFPDESFETQARKRVSLGLIIGEVIEKQGLTPDPDRVQAALERIAGSYQQPQQVIAHYRSDREQMAKVEALILEDQVVDWVLEQAVVNDEPMTFDELIKLGVSENPS